MENVVLMSENLLNPKTVNKILFVLLILLTGSIVRLYPFYQYSLEPSSYEGDGSYDLRYLLENGHALPSDRGEVILDKLNAIIDIVINPSIKHEILIKSLLQSTTYSLIIYLFAKHFSRKEGVSLDIWTIGLIIAFSFSAIPDTIVRLTGWNIPFAWILIMIFFYINLCKTQTPFTIAVELIALLLLPPTYYTLALFFVVFFIISYIFPRLYKIKKINIKIDIFNKNLILLYCLFFLSWLIYMSQSGFNLLLKIVDFTRAYLGHESRVQTLTNIAYGSQISMVKSGLSIILASVPFIYIICYGRKNIDSKIYNSLLIATGTVFAISLPFYMWMGITAIFQRIPDFISIFAVLSFSLICSSRINPNHSKYLKIIILFSIVTSTFTYLTSDYIPDKPTFSEAEGSHWLIQKQSGEYSTFTDYRLAALFTSKSSNNVYINDVSMSPKKVNTLLENIFYNVNPSTSKYFDDLNAKKPIKYLYFSNRYTIKFPGIKGFDYNYLPASKNFIEKYESYENFNTIYKNTDITILAINNYGMANK
jgi:hypothetical protein